MCLHAKPCMHFPVTERVMKPGGGTDRNKTTLAPGTETEICVNVIDEKAGIKLTEPLKIGYPHERTRRNHHRHVQQIDVRHDRFLEEPAPARMRT